MMRLFITICISMILISHILFLTAFMSASSKRSGINTGMSRSEQMITSPAGRVVRQKDGLSEIKIRLEPLPNGTLLKQMVLRGNVVDECVIDWKKPRCTYQHNLEIEL